MNVWINYKCCIFIDLTYLKVNKANTSKEYDICHDWYSLNKGFQFQLRFCNGCYIVLMKYINLNDISILDIRIVNYYWNINSIDKWEATDLLKKCWIDQKKRNIKKIKQRRRIIITYKNGSWNYNVRLNWSWKT